MTSVLLDMVRTNNLSTKTKQEQSVEISEIPLNADLSYVTIYATIYYDDGSYKLSAISDITDQIDKTIFWSDGFGSYSAQLKYGEIGNGSVIEITLDPNGGTLADGTSKQQEVVYGRNFTLPVPSKKGYEFAGWYNDKQQIADSNGSIKNWNFDNIKTTLVAKYTAKIYTITYRDVENANNPNPTSYTVEDEEIYLKPATKLGYTVAGWYSDSSLQNKVDSIYTSQAEDIELWAKWELIKFTITYYSAYECENKNPTEYTVEDENISLQVLSMEGGKFVAWCTDSDLEHEIDFIDVSQAKDIELWAKWEYTQYDLTFSYDSNIGDFVGDKPTTYTIEGLPLPQLVGKNGNGHFSVEWQDESDNVYTNEIPQGTTGDLTLTLTKWGGTHSYDNKYKCTVCGQMQGPYSEVDGEVKPYTMSDGKIIFGTYPQSKVEDTALQSMLNAKIQNKLPSSENANGWTDYGYYIGGEVQSYMWYVDVKYQGAKYRGVYFTSYRPDVTIKGNQSFKGYYYINTVYWFKWEPIIWRILSQENGKSLIMSDLILDSQQYYHEDSGARKIDGKTVYPNNYKESDIRKWLNADFYNAAFDELSKDFIIQTEVDNSASTTSNDDNGYACENTFDNVFLLSYSDVLNTSYGFKDKYNTLDTARQLKTTEYARCQGVGTEWWLRSPYDSKSSKALYVWGSRVENLDLVYSTDIGVVPALNITL